MSFEQLRNKLGGQNADTLDEFVNDSLHNVDGSAVTIDQAQTLINILTTHTLHNIPEDFAQLVSIFYNPSENMSSMASYTTHPITFLDIRQYLIHSINNKLKELDIDVQGTTNIFTQNPYTTDNRTTLKRQELVVELTPQQIHTLQYNDNLGPDLDAPVPAAAAAWGGAAAYAQPAFQAPLPAAPVYAGAAGGPDYDAQQLALALRLSAEATQPAAAEYGDDLELALALSRATTQPAADPLYDLERAIAVSQTQMPAETTQPAAAAAYGGGYDYDGNYDSNLAIIRSKVTAARKAKAREEDNLKKAIAESLKTAAPASTKATAAAHIAQDELTADELTIILADLEKKHQANMKAYQENMSRFRSDKTNDAYKQIATESLKAAQASLKEYEKTKALDNLMTAPIAAAAASGADDTFFCAATVVHKVPAAMAAAAKPAASVLNTHAKLVPVKAPAAAASGADDTFFSAAMVHKAPAAMAAAAKPAASVLNTHAKLVPVKAPAAAVSGADDTFFSAAMVHKAPAAMAAAAKPAAASVLNTHAKLVHVKAPAAAAAAASHTPTTNIKVSADFKTAIANHSQNMQYIGDHSNRNTFIEIVEKAIAADPQNREAIILHTLKPFIDNLSQVYFFKAHYCGSVIDALVQLLPKGYKFTSSNAFQAVGSGNYVGRDTIAEIQGQYAKFMEGHNIIANVSDNADPFASSPAAAAAACSALPDLTQPAATADSVIANKPIPKPRPAHSLKKTDAVVVKVPADDNHDSQAAAAAAAKPASTGWNTDPLVHIPQAVPAANILDATANTPLTVEEIRAARALKFSTRAPKPTQDDDVTAPENNDNMDLTGNTYHGSDGTDS